MNNVCDCCKKGKPWIIIKEQQTELHLCSKCYRNILQQQIESEQTKDPEMNYPRDDSIYPCDYE